MERNLKQLNKKVGFEAFLIAFRKCRIFVVVKNSVVVVPLISRPSAFQVSLWHSTQKSLGLSCNVLLSTNVLTS